jgi:hypothetical protein
MRIPNLHKRVEALETDVAAAPLVPVSYQWLKEDGSPAGPWVKRMVPKDRFGWLDDET